MRKRIEVIDGLRDWDDGFRRLEMRLAGLRPVETRAAVSVETPTRGRLADRFVVLPGGRGGYAVGEPVRKRLPAAND
jgi:hypothetical protein